jgi:hypothetical protein
MERGWRPQTESALCRAARNCSCSQRPLDESQLLRRPCTRPRGRAAAAAPPPVPITRRPRALPRSPRLLQMQPARPSLLPPPPYQEAVDRGVGDRHRVQRDLKRRHARRHARRCARRQRRGVGRAALVQHIGAVEALDAHDLRARRARGGGVRAAGARGARAQAGARWRRPCARAPGGGGLLRSEAAPRRVPLAPPGPRAPSAVLPGPHLVGAVVLDVEVRGVGDLRARGRAGGSAGGPGAYRAALIAAENPSQRGRRGGGARAGAPTVVPGVVCCGAEMVERKSSGKKLNSLTLLTLGLMQSCSGRVSRAARAQQPPSSSSRPPSARAGARRAMATATIGGPDGALIRRPRSAAARRAAAAGRGRVCCRFDAAGNRGAWLGDRETKWNVA